MIAIVVSLGKQEIFLKKGRGEQQIFVCNEVTMLLECTTLDVENVVLNLHSVELNKGLLAQTTLYKRLSSIRSNEMSQKSSKDILLKKEGNMHLSSLQYFMLKRICGPFLVG